jgi:type I restriction enzyme S subunit
MSSSSQTRKLGELVTFKTGKLDSNAAVPNGVYPFFTCSQETLRTNTFSFDTECVLLAGNNANGIFPLKYFEGKFDAYQRTYVVRPRDTEVINTKFLYYALRLKLDEFRSFSTGAATKFLTLTILNETEIQAPPLQVQRRIAGILSDYDELIENSQRRIKILELMARALYREWFVEFCFHGHESVPLVPSLLGEIPQGWEVKKLGELLNVDKGVSYNGAGLTEVGNPMVNLKNIQAGGGFRRDATKPYSGDFKPRHTVKPGDVVLANTDLTQAGNVVASPALIPRLGDAKPILISHHLYAVRPIQSIPPLFLYHLMLTEDFRGFAKGFAIGTTVLGLPKEGILNYSFACPPTMLIRDFVARVKGIHDLMETLHNHIGNLRRTRDLLLPRLLTGQIDVEAISE